MQQMQKGRKLWGKFIELSNRRHYVGTSEHHGEEESVPCLGGTLCPLQPRQIPAICAFGTWSNFDGALLPRLMSSTHTHTHIRMDCAFFQPQVLQLYSFCQQISNQRRNERTGRAAWTPAPSSALAWACALSHKYIVRVLVRTKTEMKLLPIELWASNALHFVMWPFECVQVGGGGAGDVFTFSQAKLASSPINLTANFVSYPIILGLSASNYMTGERVNCLGLLVCWFSRLGQLYYDI